MEFISKNDKTYIQFEANSLTPTILKKIEKLLAPQAKLNPDIRCNKCNKEFKRINGLTSHSKTCN